MIFYHHCHCLLLLRCRSFSFHRRKHTHTLSYKHNPLLLRTPSTTTPKWDRSWKQFPLNADLIAKTRIHPHRARQGSYPGDDASATLPFLFNLQCAQGIEMFGQGPLLNDKRYRERDFHFLHFQCITDRINSSR